MDGLNPVVPKVVVDRYRKHIREQDINRAEANYAKSAAAGALAGLVARLKKTKAAHRAMIGAGAGLLAEGIVRAAGRATKDPYGERSHAAKRSEKIPVAAGLGVAGGLAYHRIKRAAREFSARTARSARAAHRATATEEATEFAIPVRLRAKLITAAALAGGITAADAATQATWPGDDETRKQAAVKGIKQGAIYGSVLAGSEPVLRRIALKFRRKFPRKKIFEFRALSPSRDTANEEDIARQRRRLALYAGGALTGAAALALLARSSRPAGSSPVKAGVASAVPAGRGTMERLAKANALRQERGYVHLRPMTPGGRKRFDKLPVHIQAGIGKVAKTAVNPNLSGGERQKVRQLLGKIRAAHKFTTKNTNVTEFSSFVKDVAFKDLPARARKDVRAFHPDIPDDTLVAHYGMTTKELAGKADKDNLAAARKNVGKMSRKACADEVYASRGKKFVLVNNDRVIDGHHYLAKAERGRVTASLHVVDLTPSRFQKEGSMRKAGKKEKNLERKLRNAVEFMYAADASAPVGDAKPLPDWVQIRRKNKKRREQLKTAGEVAGTAGGVAAVADLTHKLTQRRKLAGAIKAGAVHVHLQNARAVTHFKRREQLREGGKAEAEKGSGRFVDPLRVTAGLTPGYATLAGGERRYYGGTRGADLPITHAQVLRSAYAHGGSIRKLAHRAGNLVRDTADVAVGNPRRTDAYGRPQRREWEKPWFHRAAKDALIGAGVLGGALALKRSPALRGKVMQAGSEIRRKVNKAIPDFFAGRKFRHGLHEFSRTTDFNKNLLPSVPFKFGWSIDYRKQQMLYDWVKQLRREVRRKAGLPIRPPIAGSLPAKPSNVIKGFSRQNLQNQPNRNRHFVNFVRSVKKNPICFDEIANYAGWDVRDPRGRSARVFAPGSRRRQRREKQWHERVDTQRKLLSALALAGTIAGAGVGVVAGRHFPVKLKPVKKIIQGPFPKVA